MLQKGTEATTSYLSKYACYMWFYSMIMTINLKICSNILCRINCRIVKIVESLEWFRVWAPEKHFFWTTEPTHPVPTYKDKKKKSQKDSETKRQRDKKTERQKDRETKRQRDEKTERRKDREAKRHKGGKTKRLKEEKTERRKTERRKDRKTKRQKDKKTKKTKKQ